ncbi:MAG TPA: 3-keto-5-aminohexanoate cleavage protein [Geminicoccus sp.]|uniref:3-keto-5-aminohexanoate cleavage protein n=1 Tax=Geminicoccus sp. TaxID=2024832 RepID=UPI002E2EA7B0|nr:3-keto-5-aminohexanoate cleavage protein [Geminicoccus sp.]HEX2529801.1 3-keto-5-aminohexanoate cleavage protein [Geminicoccus sp.]
MSGSPIAVAVAPNGARLTKADHPGLPITPDDLAVTARACLEAGACMIHLHARDAAGVHSLDPGHGRAVMEAVQTAVGRELVVQVTTEAVGMYQPDAQMGLVRALRPEAASVALRELVPDGAHEREAAGFFQWCRRERIWLQHILYDVADVARMKELVERGVVPEGPSVLYVLGRYTVGQRSTPMDLLPFLMAAPEEWRWMMCAFGAQERDCALTAALLGGHARIGFENNRLAADGTVAASNEAQVRGFVEALAALGRRPAGADELRAMIASK